MAELQYKTRGNSTPQGKPRVYLCCHPEDREGCLNQVTDWLLGQYNCALWYGDGTDDDLAAMQLFVMPVTARLLDAENSGLERFRYALRRHIPVLPLMMEHALEGQFNHICGELQFLDPYARDSTTLTFEEKLHQFLDRVLVGDEEIRMIRAAFDGYIFLSYRKKDRKYVRHLMQLIHKNDFCRDVAIWYDEYLTPGEDFNDAIFDILDKSRLFVMAVTPNLVNETNYVMTQEYPTARRMGKSILPVELASTDRAALERYYPELPPCVSLQDPVELAGALKQLLGTGMRKQRDTQHNYLIGLAYLNGIDVEVDQTRAVELITACAKAGYMDAIDKLVELYETGIGVPRDQSSAIQWQEEKIRLLEQRYGKLPDESCLLHLVQALWKCNYQYTALNRFDDAKACCLKGVELLSSVRLEESLPLRRDLSYGLGRLGELCAQTMQVGETRQWFERMMEVLRPLAEESGDETDRLNLASLYHSIGNCWEREGKLTQAIEWHEQGYALATGLAEEYASPRAYRVLTQSCNQIGKLYLARKDLSRARELFEHGESVGRVLYAENQSDDACRDLMVLCSNLGFLWQMEGDLSRTRYWYEQYLELAQALAEKTGREQDRLLLARAWRNLAGASILQSDWSTAIEQYRNSLSILRILDQIHGNGAIRMDLGRTLAMLGDAQMKAGDREGARVSYNEGMEYFFAHAEATGAEEAWYSLCAVYNAMSVLCLQEQDLEQVRFWLSQSDRILPAIAEHTDKPNTRHLLAQTCLWLGLTSTDEEERRTRLHKAADIWEKLHRAYPQTKQYADALEHLSQYLT